MVRLTTCADGLEARIIAARLGAEGIVWSIRGSYEGPLSIGSVDLLVDEDDYDDARAMLDADVELESDEPVERPAARPRDTVVLVFALVGVVLFVLLRMGARV